LQYLGIYDLNTKTLTSCNALQYHQQCIAMGSFLAGRFEALERREEKREREREREREEKREKERERRNTESLIIN